MEATSLRGIRRKISNRIKWGKPVSKKLRDALDRAIKENPEEAAKTMTVQFHLKPKKPPKFIPTKAASRGRSLSGDELEARKRELQGA